MNGKIFWFEPDFKMVGDGERIKIWSTSLSNIKIMDDLISFSYIYDDDRFDIILKIGNPGIFNGKIMCNNNDIGFIATKRFNSTAGILLEGSYNVQTEGNYGCLIEINDRY